MENFSWTPLYIELASKLLAYKDNRTVLVKWIYDDLGKVTRDDGKSLVAYLKMKDGSKIKDIDPFSVFGIFNRSTSWEKDSDWRAGHSGEYLSEEDAEKLDELWEKYMK